MSLNIEAGLPTQIRNLEKRLKEMDASKVKPALIKEITDTIKNLKDMLKEKMDKKEQRKKQKEEVSKEAISVPNAAEVGAVAPNSVTTPAPGSPAATPITPDDQKVSCPLCGGITFNDQASLQQHMEFTHASDIAPTTPGQKLDKTVASTDPVVDRVETDPKLAPGVIIPDSVKRHNDIVDRVEKDPKIAPHIISDQEPKAELEKFAVDDKVEPIRGATGSWGHVMRPSGVNGDPLVYVKWMEGPIKEKHGEYGGYELHDLRKKAEEPVQAAMPTEKPVCNDCVSNKEKQGDLKGKYEALLQDLKDERKAHYEQGNHSWTARLDDKIVDLEKAIADKFGNEKQAVVDPISECDCKHGRDEHGDARGKCYNCNCSGFQKTATGGPELIRQINKATSGHGYDSTVYNLTNGRFQQNIPLKINDTTVRMRQPENGTFEVKYPGMDWRPVLEPKFQQWLAEWKQLNQKNHQVEGGSNIERKCEKCNHSDYKHGDLGCMTCGRCQRTEQQIKRQKSNNEKESAAENAEELTIMDHTPPRANSGPDAGGKDTHDEFQDEWAEPVTSAQKISVFNKQLIATPITDQKTFGGYDISQDGKKLFNIKAKDNAPMNVKQLEFCAEIELTRNLKQAKLVDKVAFLEAGSRVYILAEDKANRRMKFASLDQGLKGWVSSSKLKLIALESQPVAHGDHQDKILGQTKTQTLLDCIEGGPIWVSSTELMDANRPPATPESLNDLESEVKCPKCKGVGIPGHGSCPECGGYATEMKERKQSDKQCPDCHGHFEGAEGETCPTCGRFAVQKSAAMGRKSIHCSMGKHDKCKDNECPCDCHVKKTASNSTLCEHCKDGLGDRYDFTCGNCKNSGHKGHPSSCPKCNKKTALEQALPKQILPQRGDVNETDIGTVNTVVQQKSMELFKQPWDALNPQQQEMVNKALGVTSSLKDKGVGEFECFECSKRFVSEGKLKDHMDASKHKSPKNSSLKVQAHIRHEDGKWVVYNHDYKKKLGTYDSEKAAKHRLQQIEYFKNASLKPFSKKAEVMADPYVNLTTHITEMRGRMDAVQEKMITMPAVKTAKDGDSEMDLSALFADLMQGINLLETKLGGEDIEPELHASVEELENLLWSLEENLGLTPDISEEEAAETEHKEVVENMDKEAKEKGFSKVVRPKSGHHVQCLDCGKSFEKYDDLKDHAGICKEATFDKGHKCSICGIVDLYAKSTEPWECPSCGNNEQVKKEADQVTDETITTNDPNAIPPATTTTPAPVIQNVQPTDQDNLEVPVAKPTSPPSPGQVWVYNPDVNAYVQMPDPANPGKSI